MNEQVLEYIKYGFWILFGSGLIFEITPVKIKPLSWLFKWIGKVMTSDIKKDIKQLGTKVDGVQNDLQNHVVESQRRDILTFANELMRGERKSYEEFRNVIKLHDRYEKYLEEKGFENGQTTLAYDYIEKRYKECQDNNSFL